MAKVINSKTDLVQTNNLSFLILQIISVGALLGIINWGLNALLGTFLSLSAAGDISMILVAVAGTAILVLSKMVQPLVIAFATCVILWGITGWYSGLGWLEAIIWTVLLYSLSYVLFYLLVRYTKIAGTIIISLIIILIERVVISL